jgi:hypothetical protein
MVWAAVIFLISGKGLNYRIIYIYILEEAYYFIIILVNKLFDAIIKIYGPFVYAVVCGLEIADFV